MRRQFRIWTGALAAGRRRAVRPRARRNPPSAQAPAPPSNPDQVVAEVGGQAITLKELDAKWEEFDAAERARDRPGDLPEPPQHARAAGRRILIENAAKAAGQPVDAFVEQDAAKRLPPVTEAEIAQFYEQNKDRAQGRTLDQLRGEIKEFLEAQPQAAGARAAGRGVEGEERCDVKVMLDPPRYTVAASADDPMRGDATAPVTLVEFSDYQ